MLFLLLLPFVVKLFSFIFTELKGTKVTVYFMELWEDLYWQCNRKFEAMIGQNLAMCYGTIYNTLLTCHLFLLLL